MDPVIERLLDDIVAFVNEAKENPESARIAVLIKNLEEDYICCEKERINYFQCFDMVFAQDTPMYLLVVSVLFFISQDGRMLCRAEKLLEKGDIPYDLFAGVALQLNVNRFMSPGLAVSYEQNRHIHRVHIQQFMQALSVGRGYHLPERVPFEQRNHKRILITTDALLDDLHAPTYIVLDFCRVLQEELGYEVMLLVAVNKVNTELVSSYWMFPYEISYDERYQGNFVRNFRGSSIRGIQILIEEKTMLQIRQLLDAIRDWNPECVWDIGGGSILSETIGKMTTLISMPCTEGYAVSEAPVLVSYMVESKPEAVIRQQYIDSQGQKSIKIKMAREFESSGKVYTPGDFGVPEDSFLIAVVGNRLSTEIDYQFIQIMEQIARTEDKVHFVLVGFCNLEWEQEPLQGRVTTLGFRKDLNDVLKSMHLFLNPVRQGGGGGANRAISMDIPVITLGDCDVATCVGEPFVCDCLEEIPALVSRYCHDRLFYGQQVEECRKRCNERRKADNAVACRTVVETVHRWLSAKEIM